MNNSENELFKEIVKTIIMAVKNDDVSTFEYHIKDLSSQSLTKIKENDGNLIVIALKHGSNQVLNSLYFHPEFKYTLLNSVDAEHNENVMQALYESQSKSIFDDFLHHVDNHDLKRWLVGRLKMEELKRDEKGSLDKFKLDRYIAETISLDNHSIKAKIVYSLNDILDKNIKAEDFYDYLETFNLSLISEDIFGNTILNYLYDWDKLELIKYALDNQLFLFRDQCRYTSNNAHKIEIVDLVLSYQNKDEFYELLTYCLIGVKISGDMDVFEKLIFKYPDYPFDEGLKSSISYQQYESVKELFDKRDVYLQLRDKLPVQNNLKTKMKV